MPNIVKVPRKFINWSHWCRRYWRRSWKFLICTKLQMTRMKTLENALFPINLVICTKSPSPQLDRSNLQSILTQISAFQNTSGTFLSIKNSIFSWLTSKTELRYIIRWILMSFCRFGSWSICHPFSAKFCMDMKAKRMLWLSYWFDTITNWPWRLRLGFIIFYAPRQLLSNSNILELKWKAIKSVCKAVNSILCSNAKPKKGTPYCFCTYSRIRFNMKYMSEKGYS